MSLPPPLFVLESSESLTHEWSIVCVPIDPTAQCSLVVEQDHTGPYPTPPGQTFTVFNRVRCDCVEHIVPVARLSEPGMALALAAVVALFLLSRGYLFQR